ncbi:MAG: hypothetical protein H0T44_14520 [Gemmatimonadales bacterium]|nr:hypothetical protein [Gemmatimonadales bacterium]
MQQIKGAVLKSRMAFVEEQFGKEGVQRILAGWYRRALETCGISGVRIVEEECRATGGKVCRYRVRWT